MKVSLFSLALVQLVDPMLWWEWGLPSLGSGRVHGGTDQRVFLCTPGSLEYLGNAVISCWVGSCLVSQLAVSLHTGGGRFLPHLPLESSWDRIAGWPAACLRVAWGEHPNLLLLCSVAQGTERSPQLHNLHAQVVESLGQHFPYIMLSTNMTQKSQLQPDFQTSADVAGVFFSLWSRALALVACGGCGDNNWRKSSWWGRWNTKPLVCIACFLLEL